MSLSLNVDVDACASQSFERKPGSIDDELGKFIKYNDTANTSKIEAFPIIRINTLGRGTSSIVYKSVWLKTLKVCAEKVFVVSDAHKRSQLCSELESLKLAFSDSVVENANNIYLVKPMEILSNHLDGTLSLCLEYMNGGSLQDLVESGGCDNEAILATILFQMIKGLSFLHSLRIIHRDLKPGNVLLSSTGQVKLADFGLARTLELGQSLADSFVGTFDFMAPERLAGDAYSFASDIWSCGLTIHTVAIGRYPYKGAEGRNSYWELLHATNGRDNPLPPSPPFSRHFVDFVAVSCRKDANQRPTAAALLTHPFILYNDTRSNIVSICKRNHVKSCENNKVPTGNPIALSPSEGRSRFSASHKMLLRAQSGETSSADSDITLKDMYKLVRSWKACILQRRWTVDSVPPSPQAVIMRAPSSHSLVARSVFSVDSDLFSPPSAFSSSSLDLSPPHMVTEEVLTVLAHDLPCDLELLKQCFRHALLDIQRQFVGSVGVIDSSRELSGHGVQKKMERTRASVLPDMSDIQKTKQEDKRDEGDEYVDDFED